MLSRIKSFAFTSLVSSYVKMIDVPLDEIWVIHGISVSRGAGDRTASIIALKQMGIYFPIYNTGTPFSAYTTGILNQPVKLAPGSEIHLYFSNAGAAEGAWECILLYQKQKVANFSKS